MAWPAWTEVAPGKWQRPMDTTERFIKVASDLGVPFGREHWTVNTVARIRFDDDAEAPDSATLIDRLRTAWLWTRYEAPFVAVLLDGNDVLKYEVPDQASLDEWLNQSFHVHGKGDPAGATVDDFLALVKPAPYPSLHYFPTSSELVLRIHHWLNHGAGCLNTLGVFLRNYSQDRPAPTFGDEPGRLAPSFSEVAGFPVNVSAEAQEHAQNLFFSFVGNLPSAGFPFQSPSPQGLGATKRHQLEFPPSVTEQLVTKCRNHGFTVTAAVHAAVLLFLQDNSTPATAGKNYTSVMSIDYRPYIQPEYNDAKKWPMGPYMMGLPITVPPTSDFLAAAKLFQQGYHQPLRKGESSVFEAYNTYADSMSNAFSAPLPDGVPPPTQPQLSSLGRIETKLQHTYADKRKLDLLDIQIALDMVGPGSFVYLWSWENRFFLMANFNESFYKMEWMKDMLDQVSRILFKGLDISV